MNSKLVSEGTTPLLTIFTTWRQLFSEEFTTVTGVKQGCLLSPLLFTLYLNDLHEFLEGGIHINNLNVRLLMYADDIVILADDVYVLRRMIKRLEEYCLLWAVEVNLEKSEIMVFRKGGRLAKEEDWQFRGQRIRVVSEYCYLGVTLTPSMSFSKHLQKRNQAAKNCINTTWSKFFSRQNISLQSKWKLFLAVCRSIQAYGAQVWGHALFDEVDNLQLFFVKKVLRLPSFTPTYALMLETGIENGYIFTLDLHMRYMAKTLFEYSEDRLPHKFSKIVLQKNIFWVKKLNEIGLKFSIEWTQNLNSKHLWNSNSVQLLTALRNNNYGQNLRRKDQTNRIYRDLDARAGETYINTEHNAVDIMWIFKARTDLIELNANRFGVNLSRICAICNMNEVENLYHFLGRCVAYKDARISYFKKDYLDNTEIINILNGVTVDFKMLVGYIKYCIQYRKILIEEFNY